VVDKMVCICFAILILYGDIWIFKVEKASVEVFLRHY
jgi:hypothetical protein